MASVNLGTLYGYGQGSSYGVFYVRLDYDSITRYGDSFTINNARISCESSGTTGYTTNTIYINNCYINGTDMGISGSFSGRTYYGKTWTSSSVTKNIAASGSTSSVSISCNGGRTGSTSSFNGSGTLSIGQYTLWNDINVLSPSGSQDYKSGYFDLYISANGKTYTNLTNETDTTQPYGSYFEVYNIRPYYDYYELNTVEGADSIPSAGHYRKTFDGADEVMTIKMKYKSYYLDLNGQLDGTDSGSLGSYGTATVTANGSTSSNVADYYQAHPYDKSYSITNITAKSGYQYDGLASGSAALSGTIGTGKNVRLKFSTIKPSALKITRSSSTTTSISGTVSATGLNISNYTLYYKKASASSYTSKSLGTTTSWSLTGLDVDTDYNMYLSVTNPGGTTTSSSSPVTFSTTLNNPTIGTPVVTDLLPFSCTVTASGSVTPSRTLNYRISIDNGITWSAYQSSNVFNLTGLSEETTYNMKVQVKAIHTGTDASDTTATSASFEVITPADQAKIRIKDNGEWKKGKTWYKKNGAWVKAKKIYIKKEGQWVIGYNYEN